MFDYICSWFLYYINCSVNCHIQHFLFKDFLCVTLCKHFPLSGDVVTMECVEKVIQKDMICPMTGKKLREADIVPLVRGGTGFAGNNINTH